MLSKHPGLQYGKRRTVRPPFKWFEFERSLDNELFYNVHRMDKPSCYALHKAMLLSLHSKYKRPDRARLMTMSYFGGARICDLRVLCQPNQKRSYIHAHGTL